VRSVPPSSMTPTSRGSSLVGALGCSGPSNAVEDRGPDVPSVGATYGGEGLAPDMPVTADTTTAGDGSLAPEVETMVAAGETSSLKAGVVAGQDLATSSSGPTVSLPFPQPQAADASSLAGTDDIIREELEAVFGHPPSKGTGGCLPR
jgi:hypothetical protein